MYFSLLLYLSLCTTTIFASPLAALAERSFAKRNNINKYGGCDAGQKAKIQQAYKDTLKLADNIRPFLQYHDELFVSDVGLLEKRFFGDDIAANNDPKPALIRTVINNIANWYPWPIFDWIGGKRIEVHCVDLPNKADVKCASRIGNKQQFVGAYALSENGYQIVFCPPFFQQDSLDQVEASLRADTSKQKNLPWMKSSAHIFFHEMTHLTVIEGTTTVVVKDLPADPYNRRGTLTYGPKLCEKLARRFPSYAGNNADNIAWYATAKYFEKKFGTPDPSIFSLSDDDEAGDTGPGLDVLDAHGADPITQDPPVTGYEVDKAEIDDVLAYAAQNFKNNPGTLTFHPQYTASATPVASSSIALPAPTQTSSNCKGSSNCGFLVIKEQCQKAYAQYVDATLYTAYTSYVDRTSFAGCAAMFTCDNDAAYKQGMLGSQIKAAFDNLYNNDGCKICGSSYLSNSCHVTANACNNCKPTQ